jgi:thiosulfate/3-mercaptopyruvate sulfurtransferase
MPHTRHTTLDLRDQHSSNALPPRLAFVRLSLDCRFDLAAPEAGTSRCRSGTWIPGARYLHLDRDLSGAKTGKQRPPSVAGTCGAGHAELAWA